MRLSTARVRLRRVPCSGEHLRSSIAEMMMMMMTMMMIPNGDLLDRTPRALA
jgi:hypothetical protein